MTILFDPDLDAITCKTCGFFSCVCAAAREHEEGCRYLGAMRCPVSIECQHGFDVCPKCDPCTCADVRKLRTEGLRPL